MPKKQWNQVKELFHEALRHDTGERDAFLDTACGGNIELRIEVESLLIALSDATTFLEEPLIVDKVRESPWQLSEGQSISHYTIVSPIGIGGMGEVYLARDNQLHRSVALKILPADLANDAARLRRFQNEAEAVSALNHPNILTIFEFGEVDGVHIFASEFVKGETLRQRLSRERRLPVAEAVDIATQTASALKAAHEAGVIHRDIKPENLMIRDDGYVKVLDFGLAKFSAPAVVDGEAETRAQDLSHPGMIMGTTSYMSPEQARGRPIDARTDLFSFGVVLHEMLGGHVPFRGITKTDVLAAILQYDPPPVSSHNSKVPPQIDAIVMKCLEKSREDRYASAADLLAELKASAVPEATPAVGDEELTAADEPTANRGLSRWIAAAAAAAVLALAALTAAYFTGRLGSAATAAPQIRSLAVLPLKSLDAGDNYLGLGIADAVIRRISQTGELNVRPTSAVRRYANEETDALTAAKQLGADAVLEGSIQQANNRLRVSVNLLRSGDGVSLWAENFDMSKADVFAIQDSVAQRVAERLRLPLDSEQKAKLATRTTSNPIAYEFYVKGLNSFDQREVGPAGLANTDATIDLFKRAVDTEPGYALAHAMLGQAYVWKGMFNAPDEQEKWSRLANEEALKAESIDPNLAETHLVSSGLLFGSYGGYRLDESMREILKAQQINPGIGHLELAEVAYHVGLEDVSEREFQRALEIDPTSEHAKRDYLYFYALVNRWDDYLVAKQKYFPEKPAFGFYYLAKGQLGEARRYIDEEAAKDPQSDELPDLRAVLYALEGKTAEAEEQVPLLLKTTNPLRPDYHHATYDIACVYALLGKTDEAVKWLRVTADKGNPSYLMFTRDPFLDKIRGTPQFVQFMAETKTRYDRYAAEFGGG